MEFAVNYSLEAMELLARREIRVDRLKCADWPDMIAEASRTQKVYVHFPFDVGARLGRPMDLERAETMARRTETPFVNFHMVSYARDFPDLPRDSVDGDLVQEITHKMIADTQAAIDRLGRDRVIIENIPWFGGAGEFHRPSVEAKVINEVVGSTNAGFLLDLSHARIAAHYLGLDPHEYVESLPVQSLRELHITGVRMHKTRLADHLDLRQEDWEFFDWAMERIARGDWAGPWMVAFEYGGIGEPFKWRSSIEVLREQVPRLYERVKNSTI